MVDIDIDGVEVLRKTELFKLRGVQDYSSVWVVLAVGILLLLVVIAILTPCLKRSLMVQSNVSFIIGIFAVVWVVILGFLCGVVFLSGFSYEVVSAGKFRYEVTLSDDVDLSELYKRYDVVGTYGDKIYILETKDEVSEDISLKDYQNKGLWR